jgi:hypothetical protein
VRDNAPILGLAPDLFAGLGALLLDRLAPRGRPPLAAHLIGGDVGQRLRASLPGVLLREAIDRPAPCLECAIHCRPGFPCQAPPPPVCTCPRADVVALDCAIHGPALAGGTVAP